MQNVTDNKPPDLFSLPAELRTYIYELVLFVPTGHPFNIHDSIYTHETHGRPRRRITPVIQPPLTRTCAQIRAEALPIYYASSSFYLGSFKSALSGLYQTTDYFQAEHAVLDSTGIVFLSAIGSEQRQLLTRLYISVSDGDIEALEAFLLDQLARQPISIVEASRKESVLVSSRDGYRWAWKTNPRLRITLYRVSFNPPIHRTAMPKAKPPTLLTLPAELRIQIFELVLYLPTGHTIIIENKIYTRAKRRRISPVATPPLARTCRQIRQEALPIYYASCSFYLGTFQGHFKLYRPFRVDSNIDAIAFLTAIGPEQRSMIKRLYIGIPETDSAENKDFFIRHFDRQTADLTEVGAKEGNLVSWKPGYRSGRRFFHRKKIPLFHVTFALPEAFNPSIVPGSETMKTNLFSLPAELRIRIYELVLYLPTGHTIHLDDKIRTRRTKRRFSRRLSPVTQPPLTRTCAQIRAESLSIFYASARFYLGKFSIFRSLDMNTDAISYLTAIGSEQRAMIKRLYIGCDGKYEALVHEFMSGRFEGTVEVGQASWKDRVFIAAGRKGQERHYTLVTDTPWRACDPRPVSPIVAGPVRTHYDGNPPPLGRPAKKVKLLHIRFVGTG